MERPSDGNQNHRIVSKWKLLLSAAHPLPSPPAHFPPRLMLGMPHTGEYLQISPGHGEVHQMEDLGWA